MERTINRLLSTNDKVIAHCSDDTMWSLSEDMQNWSKLPEIPQEEEELYQLGNTDIAPINLKDVVSVTCNNYGYDKANRQILLDIEYTNGKTIHNSYGHVDLYYTNSTPYLVTQRDKDFEYIKDYLSVRRK
tara:strand:+ start:80 stop:472 length:393 start_codon:yes stop_codon:yes gene_type:complete